MAEPWRVLLVDDSPLARAGARALLARQPGFVVVGEADDGLAGVEAAAQLLPDLVLMDISMPRCDGLLATRLLKARLPRVAVVMLTVSDDAADLFEAIKTGAQGYLLKNMQPEDWVEYLQGVMHGEGRISRNIAQRILAEFTARPEPPRQDPTEQLSERETEVLQLITQAKTAREIAEALHISEYTAKNHISNILAKLHARNRLELVASLRSRTERGR